MPIVYTYSSDNGIVDGSFEWDFNKSCKKLKCTVLGFDRMPRMAVVCRKRDWWFSIAGRILHPSSVGPGTSLARLQACTGPKFPTFSAIT